MCSSFTVLQTMLQSNEEKHHRTDSYTTVMAINFRGAANMYDFPVPLTTFQFQYLLLQIRGLNGKQVENIITGALEQKFHSLIKPNEHMR